MRAKIASLIERRKASRARWKQTWALYDQLLAERIDQAEYQRALERIWP